MNGKLGVCDRAPAEPHYQDVNGKCINWRPVGEKSTPPIDNKAHFPVYKIEIVCKDTFGDTHKEYLMRMIEERIKFMLENDFILSVSHFKLEEQNVTDIR